MTAGETAQCLNGINMQSLKKHNQILIRMLDCAKNNFLMFPLRIFVNILTALGLLQLNLLFYTCTN